MSTDQKLQKLREIIRKSPGLIWYSTSHETLGVESIVEAIVNYGTWDQFLEAKNILGIKELAGIFNRLDSAKRSNLLPIYRSYFREYFYAYAS